MAACRNCLPQTCHQTTASLIAHHLSLNSHKALRDKQTSTKSSVPFPRKANLVWKPCTKMCGRQLRSATE